MKNAKATTRGWINPKTGELLKAQKMTQQRADELNGVEASAPAPQPEPVRVPEQPRSTITLSRFGGNSINVESNDSPKEAVVTRLGGTPIKIDQ